MQYADIFTLPPWDLIAISVLQAATVFCFIMTGLELVGRRVFAQRGPQDLVIIVLVAEACDIGLAHEEAGYWGAIASATTLLILGHLTVRLPALRRILDDEPVILFHHGKLQRKAMKKHMIDIEDLEAIARDNGKKSYKDFEIMMLEGCGKISAL